MFISGSLRIGNVKRRNRRSFVMSDLKAEVISRRKALSLLGLATLSLTVPATVLTVSDAEAQAQPTPAAPTTGTERRQERRTGRVKRRTRRWTARRKGRADRGEVRRGGGAEEKQKQRPCSCKTRLFEGPPAGALSFETPRNKLEGVLDV